MLDTRARDKPTLRRGLRVISDEHGTLIDGGPRRVALSSRSAAHILDLLNGTRTVDDIGQLCGQSPDSVRLLCDKLQDLGVLYFARSTELVLCDGQSAAGGLIERLSAQYGVENPSDLLSRLAATCVAVAPSLSDTTLLSDLGELGCIVAPGLNVAEDAPIDVLVCDREAPCTAWNERTDLLPVVRGEGVAYVGPVITSNDGPCGECFFASVDDHRQSLVTRPAAAPCPELDSLLVALILERIVRRCCWPGRHAARREVTTIDAKKLTIATLLLFGESGCRHRCDPGASTSAAIRFELLQGDEPDWHASHGHRVVSASSSTAETKLRRERDELPGCPRYRPDTRGRLQLSPPFRPFPNQALEIAETLEAPIDRLFAVLDACLGTSDDGVTLRRQTPSIAGLGSQEAYVLAPTSSGHCVDPELQLLRYSDLTREMIAIGRRGNERHECWAAVRDSAPRAVSAIVGTCALWRLVAEFGSNAQRAGMLDAGVAWLGLELAAGKEGLRLSPVNPGRAPFSALLVEEEYWTIPTFVAAVELT